MKHVSVNGEFILDGKIQVRDMLKKKAKGTTTALVNAVYSKLRYNIANDIYRKRPKSKYYDRTYDFLNSIVKVQTDKIQAGVFDGSVEHIPELLTPEIRRTKYHRVFNAHMDFYHNDTTNILFNLQEDGYTVPRGRKKSNEKKIRGTKSLQKTETYLKNKLKLINGKGNNIDVYSNPITGDIEIVTSR